jgi:hypothetical protein
MKPNRVIRRRWQENCQVITPDRAEMTGVRKRLSGGQNGLLFLPSALSGGETQQGNKEKMGRKLSGDNT